VQNIAEKFNYVSRVHRRYRQTDGSCHKPTNLVTFG